LSSSSSASEASFSSEEEKFIDNISWDTNSYDGSESENSDMPDDYCYFLHSKKKLYNKDTFVEHKQKNLKT
jgi:hypothetical protein